MPNKDNNNQDVWSIRKEYKRSNLSEIELLKDPFDQFEKWYNEAIENKIEEPNAMALATADLSGKVSVRFVLLKGFDSAGYKFYTNYESNKGKQLGQNNQASIAIYWKELERQIRIEGVVEKLAEADSISYYKERPRDAKIGAWASKQSSIISSREELEQRYKDFDDKFKDIADIPKPSNWGGYILKPQYFEFWQGRVGRLHDRFCYKKEELNWICNRLSP
jgi:pyridoxamine 5'-phosphate oxidase